MTRPTRIIEPPAMVRTGDGESGHLVMMITCDDGCEYTVAALAKAIGVHAQTMYRRLRKYPWHHPEILNEVMGCEKMGGFRPSEQGNELWQKLSSRERFSKLAGLNRIGVLESRYYQ